MEIPDAALTVIPYQAPVVVDPPVAAPVAPPVAQPVSPPPVLKADFSYIANGDVVTFTDKSTGAVSVQFWPGNGTPRPCPVGGSASFTYGKDDLSVIWEATDADGHSVKKSGSVDRKSVV